MFNSVARYLWGDAEVPTVAEADEVQLEVTQDEDWVVVDAGGAGSSENEQSTRIPRSCPEDDVEGPTLPSVNARRREVQERQLPGGVLSSEQVAVKLHAAQKCQRKKSSKSLSKHKLQRENKVYDKSWAKNCGSQNRRVRPSGCKAGRMCQRV